MASVFTGIINGSIPANIVAETEHAIAFLDVRPLKRGHTLVVPKMEVDKLFDLPQDVYRHLWDLAYNIGRAIGEAIPCNRVGVAVLGLEVPHAHIHLVPIDFEHDLRFSNDRMKFTDTENAATAMEIAAKI